MNGPVEARRNNQMMRDLYNRWLIALYIRIIHILMVGGWDVVDKFN